MDQSDSRQAQLATTYRYHDGTKHHFDRLAASLGYLDWASQPKPFRQFTDTTAFALYPTPGVRSEPYTPRRTTFDEAWLGTVAPEPLSAPALGDLLRHALGLSAWKRLGPSRWALRVNPSSGNLHPTEAYVVCGALSGLATRPAVYHYAPDRHAIELRCAFDEAAWLEAIGGRQDVLFVALTSIHWREAWKYGERAFRYCQHDLGHAIAALSFSAALVGWRTAVLPAWSHDAIGAVTGIDRDADFFEAEREEPGCILAIGPGDPLACTSEVVSRLVEGVRGGHWAGSASQLSEAHVDWSFIGEVARATENAGRPNEPERRAPPAAPAPRLILRRRYVDARGLVLQRRSAVAFDRRSTLDREHFLDLLARVLPASSTMWDGVWWTPRIHLAIFVHGVDEVPQGLYLMARDSACVTRMRAACRTDFLWEAADADLPLWCLARADTRALAARLSCDQAIASDGFFSLGMVADFDAGLQAHGPSFYRQLFWEAGMVGQALYLGAEAAGVRGTGIGCFYDDAVHDVLGLQGHAFQSLYHFTVGAPVEDARLTTEPGYAWPDAR